MKALRLKVLGLLFVLVTASCSDWLYMEPEDGIVAQDYWKSGNEVESFMIGCYASMLGNNQTGSYSVAELMFLWGEARADMLTYYNTILYSYLLIWQGDIKPTNYFCKWNSLYRTINYCNTVLERGPEVLDLDDSFTQEKMNQYRSEALAIRALMYFYLTRAFGDVPLVLNATLADDQQLAVAKSSKEVVIDQIKKDLLEAEKYAVYSYGSSVEENKGRINYYIIKAIEADVYLWNEEYQSCEKACNEIITSGLYWLVPGDDLWLATLFDEGNSSEGIFELQFNQSILNPYYAMFETNKYYRANPDVMEIFWPTDELADPDSSDVRGDRGAYRSSRNYNIWKYIGRDRNDDKGYYNAYSNFIVYRYADVLLMKAEAIAGQLDEPNEERGLEALNLIKMVRKRGRASNLTDQGNSTDKEGLYSYILDERAREFAFEGKRWFDVLRFAKRDNYQRLKIMMDMLKNSAPPDKLLSIQSKMKDYNAHYLPIPQADIDAGYPYLVQNPFYDQSSNN